MLKKENKIDADAVKKLRDEKNAETSRANKAENELGRLQSEHKGLLDQWNAISHKPEFEEAVTKIYERKERKNRLIDAFIREGREELQSFARTTRLTFSEREARYIYYGDYLDPYTYYDGILPTEALSEFQQILQYKKDNPERVTLLMGNHDILI